MAIIDKIRNLISGSSTDYVLKDNSGTQSSHLHDKSQVGLGEVDNTSDVDKPISTATQTALNGKVDKVTGKGLSTNDYTTAEKTKLAGIESGANKTVVDSALSSTSTNPVQNKVIKDALDKGVAISLQDMHTTIAAEVQSRAPSYKHMQFYTLTNGGSEYITDLPLNARSFCITANLKKHNNDSDYAYSLSAWMLGDAFPYVCEVKQNTSVCVWEQVANSADVPYIINADSATTAIFDEAVSRYNSGKLVFIRKGVYILQCVGATSAQMLFESVAGGTAGISKGVIDWRRGGSVPSITWLNAAARDGSNATGTWGIDISGNAATATNATNHIARTDNPHSVTKAQVGLGNVENVSVSNGIPTFTEASTRANIASGEKMSVLFGKIKKWYADLKTVAWTGSYNDLSNKPTIPPAITVDSALSSTSTNPVQNKVVKSALDGRANKVTGATNGHFAGLDSSGNLTDSGNKASDFATAAQGAKADTALQSADMQGYYKDYSYCKRIVLNVPANNGVIILFDAPSSGQRLVQFFIRYGKASSAVELKVGMIVSTTAVTSCIASILANGGLTSTNYPTDVRYDFQSGVASLFFRDSNASNPKVVEIVAMSNADVDYTTISYAGTTDWPKVSLRAFSHIDLDTLLSGGGIGSATQPVCVDSNGQLVPCNVNTNSCSSGLTSSYTFNGSTTSMFISYNGNASVDIQVGNLESNVLYSIYSCSLSSTYRSVSFNFVKGSLTSDFNVYGEGVNGTSMSTYTISRTQGLNDAKLHFVRNGSSIYIMGY